MTCKMAACSEGTDGSDMTEHRSCRIHFLMFFVITLACNVCGQGPTANYDVTTTSQAETEPLSTAESSINTTADSNSTSSSPHINSTVNTTEQPTTNFATSTTTPSYFEFCPSQVKCTDLSADCLDCELSDSCIYGREYNVTCTPKPNLNCTGNQSFIKPFRCRYCYQSDPSEYTCTPTTNCGVHTCPPTMIKVNCSVNDDVLCLGNRKFYRRNRCNWTSGYRWTTALALSITLGGFGADRFYIGRWPTGVGKLFSFGGLGVWTLVDVVLIAVGYLGPEDGSHYI